MGNIFPIGMHAPFYSIIVYRNVSYRYNAHVANELRIRILNVVLTIRTKGWLISNWPVRYAMVYPMEYSAAVF